MKNSFLLFMLLFCAFSSEAKSEDSNSIFLKKAIVQLDHNKIEAANQLFEEAISFQKKKVKKEDDQ